MRVFAVLLLFCAVLALPCGALATEEYAKKTGKECAACHLDPGGGGELTAAGKAYAASLATSDKGESGAAPATAAQQGGGGVPKKVLHLVAGYLHLLTAILWFGTILYVHLVLKPQYAAGGLPKGEVRVGALSMVVIALSGAVLMHFRVTSPEMLLHTRFGILLLVKIGLYLVMVVTAAFAVLLIGPRLKAQKKGGNPATHSSGSLTPEELSYFDGKEGRSAYFAYRGKIYDATASKLWKAGVHMGRHHAGEEMTEMLKQAPHGSEQVTALPVVGDLVAGAEGPPLHVRVFYVMAYLNLSIVFVIVFIVSLWRWW